MIRNGRMQGTHGLAEQGDCLRVMTKVRASNPFGKQGCSMLVITAARNISPHRRNSALLFTPGLDGLNCVWRITAPNVGALAHPA